MNNARRNDSILFAVNAGNTVLAQRCASLERSAYTPHGHRSPGTGPGRPGFNGEYLERIGVQLLGSYRAYSPALMHFHRPDRLSPFEDGGLNAYAYCLGDPLNHVDPTGHMPWWAWAAAGLILPSFIGVGLGIATGAAFLPTATAAVSVVGSTATYMASLVVPEGKARQALGLVSFALGVVAAAASTVVVTRWASRLARTPEPPVVVRSNLPPPDYHHFAPPLYSEVTQKRSTLAEAIRVISMR